MKTRAVIFLIAILGFSFFLRFYKIAGHDLWYDEVTSVNLAHKVEHPSAWNKHPPLYFLFLKAWIHSFGESELALRVPSLLFGCLGVAAGYLVAAGLFGEGVGILTAAILACSPVHIWYAQEVRPYTLLPLFVTLATYFLFAAFRRNRFRYWCGFWLALACSFYTAYIALLLIPAFIGVFLLEKNRQEFLRSFCWSMAAAVAVFLPCVPILIDRYFYHAVFTWFRPIGYDEYLLTIENFNVGFNASSLMDRVAFPVFFCVFAFGLLARRMDWRKTFQCLLLFALPIGILYAYSLHRASPIYRDRQLLMASPFYYMLLARGLWLGRPRFLRVSLIAAIFLLMFWPLTNYYRYFFPDRGDWQRTWVRQKQPVRPLVAFLKPRMRSGDCIAHTDWSTETLLRFYWRDNPYPQYLFISSVAGKSFSGYADAGVRFGDISQAIRIPTDKNKIKGERIWLIATGFGRDGLLNQNSEAVIPWLDKEAVLRQKTALCGTQILLYEKKK